LSDAAFAVQAPVAQSNPAPDNSPIIQKALALASFDLLFITCPSVHHLFHRCANACG
jgi:hypothetical protein